MASERFQRRIERLLDEADEALARYDWEAVRQAAQAVLAIDPENGDGLTFLATVERALASTPGSSTTQSPGSAPATAPRAESLLPERFGPLQGVRILSTGTIIAQPFAAAPDQQVTAAGRWLNATVARGAWLGCRERSGS